MQTVILPRNFTNCTQHTGKTHLSKVDRVVTINETGKEQEKKVINNAFL